MVMAIQRVVVSNRNAIEADIPITAKLLIIKETENALKLKSMDLGRLGEPFPFCFERLSANITVNISNSETIWC